MSRVGRPPGTTMPTKQRKSDTVVVRLTAKQRKAYEQRGGAPYVRRVLDTPLEPAHDVGEA